MRITEGRGLITPSFKLMIGCPTRDNRCSFDFMISMVQTCELMTKLGIDVVIAKAPNDCFVDLARNIIVDSFYTSDCTHLLFVDDDMSWQGDDVFKMLKKNKDLLVAVGRKKCEAIDYAAVEYVDKDGALIGELAEKEEDVLLRMKYAGAAFMLIKKSVIEKMYEEYHYYKCKQVGEGAYSLFRCEYTQEQFHTEDYMFCKLWERIGGEIWCYPNVTLGHLGQKDYKGNYFDYLKSLKKG